MRVGGAGLVVENGATLTLPAGTRLLFSGGALVVRGRLVASGQETSPVVLAAAPGRGPWAGVEVAAGGRAELSHVRVEEAGAGVASVALEDGALVADHLDIVPADVPGIRGLRSSITVTDSVFESFGEHEVIHGYGLSRSARLELRRLTFHPVSGFHDLVDFARCPGSEMVALVEDSTFEGGSDDGVDTDSCGFEIRRCTFRNFHREAWRHRSAGVSAGTGARVHVADSVFEDNDNGVIAMEAASVTLEGCRLVGNRGAAVRLSETGPPGGRIRMVGCRLEHNAALALSIDEGSALDTEDSTDDNGPLPAHPLEATAPTGG